MGYSIIGTAGHVDHGKTRLIKALTGIDADRLAEEKRRGITIELGFAYLELPDGGRAGIIDVPGHEKFIGNMLAGAGTVDVALLVVAADEGFMPQTREHLDILTLLGVKRGVVALTKTDLADAELRELVVLEIEDELADTFLKDAPVVPVSAETGEGIDELKQRLYEALFNAPEKKPDAPFRLPVDRIFSAEGFGVVVTGTLIEGTLVAGDEIAVYPSMLKAKARNIQVHGRAAGTAVNGQRVAVNLSGVKKENINRGDVLAAPGSMEPSLLLEVRLDILSGTDRTILNNSRLHFHHGSGVALCRVVLMECDELKKGQCGYAQLRFAKPVAAKPGDRFVARFYSPAETVGGGVILDPCPAKHKRGDPDAVRGMKIKESGSLIERITQVFFERGVSLPSRGGVGRVFFNGGAEYDAGTDALTNDGTLYEIDGGGIIHREVLARLGRSCADALSVYHTENPLRPGMRKDELKARLLPDAEQPAADKIFSLLAELGFIRLTDGAEAGGKSQYAARRDFNVSINETQLKIKNELTKIYSDAGFAPPAAEDVEASYEKNKKAYKQVFDALVKEGELVMLTPQIFLHRDVYGAAVVIFKRLASEQSEVTLGEYRDALGTSRKYAVAILEYFDRRGFTKKIGDARVAGRMG